MAKWLDIFERLYAIFRLSPFGAARIRAVKKEQKHYHADWTLVSDRAFAFREPGGRSPNQVGPLPTGYGGARSGAAVLSRRDRPGGGLRGHGERKAVHVHRCKWDDAPVNKALRYLKKRFPLCPAYQIAATGKKDFETPDGIRVYPAPPFLRELV